MLRAMIVTLILQLFAPPAFAAERPAGRDRYGEFLFGVDYYPEHWPESLWEEDATRMQACGVNAVRIGEFAWYYFEPRRGAYQFDLFDRAIAVLAKHEIKTILGTPTAAPPKWLTHDHPEVLAVASNGRPVNDQTRRHYTYTSPVYRRFCREIVTAMADHYKGNPNVIGWQIDNEFNCHIDEFFGEPDRLAFRAWLKEKYQTLDQLNERWGNRFWSQWYTSWDQIDLPFPAPAYHNPALVLDYRRCISDAAISFQREQVEIIRERFPDAFITHNDYQARNLDFFGLCKDLDIFAFDNYPCFSDAPQYSIGANLTMARAFKGSFFVIEQQTGPGGQTYLLRGPRPGEMSLWAFQAVALGADGMMHFRWRTARAGAEQYWYGVLDHDNVPRARFLEFQKEGRELRKIGPAILGSRIETPIAVIKDFEAEWVFDYEYLTKEVSTRSAFEHFYRAASELKHQVDFIAPSDDFGRYKLVFAPYLVLIDEKLASRIKEFIAGGGVFVMSAHSAVKNRDNAMTAQTIPILVGDVFGVELETFQCYEPPSAGKNAIAFDGGPAIPVNVFADVLRLTSARPVARWRDDFLAGGPACTERALGRGMAVYYGSFFNREAARYLVERYAQRLKLEPILAGVPDDVEVARRTKGGVDFYFILNHAAEERTIAPGAGFADMIAGAPFPGKATLKPFGYLVLRKERS